MMNDLKMNSHIKITGLSKAHLASTLGVGAL